MDSYSEMIDSWQKIPAGLQNKNRGNHFYYQLDKTRFLSSSLTTKPRSMKFPSNETLQLQSPFFPIENTSRTTNGHFLTAYVRLLDGNSSIYLCFAGDALPTTTFPETNSQHVKDRPSPVE